MGSKKGAPARALQLAKEYLMAHPTASNEDVIQATGVSSRSVSSARQVLVQMGLLQRSFHDRRHRSAEPDGTASAVELPTHGPSEEASDAMEVRRLAALEQSINKDIGEPLTPDEMRRRYARIADWARNNKEFTLEIQAIQAHARLDSQLGARDRLGPGPPLTRPQKVERVGLICQAAAPSIVAEACVMYWDRRELDKFIDEIGRFMARKAPDGVPNQETAPLPSDEGALYCALPDSGPHTTPESGLGDTIDRAEGEGTGGTGETSGIEP